MIMENDLMIGNVATKWIKLPIGNEHQVRTPYSLTIDDLVECSKGTAIFKGVELTEEILLNLGFVPILEYKEMGGHRYAIPNDDSNFSFDFITSQNKISPYGDMRNLKYVHQFQNYYKLVTLKDLTWHTS